jgi:phosphoglycolate phosphatase
MVRGVLIRHLILDWSGTLVDDLGPVLKTTNHVLRTCGVGELTREEFREQFCLPVREFYRPRVSHLSMAELEAIFLAKYDDHRHEISLLPHTVEFLRFCAARQLEVFVASSADLLTYQTQMARFGIAAYITRPYLGIEDKTQKIHQILAENALDPRATLFVGDMEHDIAAGKAGGVRTCAVLTGYNPSDKLRALSPDLVCADLGELQCWLAGQIDGASE